MSLPRKLADRLTALGYDPERFADMAGSEGVDFVRGFIEKLEEADRLYRQWSPKLRDFAAKCRLKNPCPEASTLSDRDHAKQSIYASLINKAERLPGRPTNEVLLCSLPLVAMPIALSLWPGQDERCVLLTPEEIAKWQKIYQHPEESFRWYTHYWWWIEDPPRPNSIWTQDIDLQAPLGTDPWLAVSGLSWGSLAGGENADLWSWNGKQAQFVRSVGVSSF